MFILIVVQTVHKDDPQTTKVTASRQRVNLIFKSNYLNQNIISELIAYSINNYTYKILYQNLDLGAPRYNLFLTKSSGR